MQDRYSGDIGDFVKLSLVRALASRKRLGIAWYRYPDERHNADGKHVAYLNHPETWRHRDAELFDRLKAIVTQGKRSVAALEEAFQDRECKFAADLTAGFEVDRQSRGSWRQDWFEQVQSDLSDVDIVFADPDNGLCEDHRFRPGRAKDWKRLPLTEARALGEGRIGLFYHHNTRRKGGHYEEVRYWKALLGANSCAVYFRAVSPRTFFVSNATAETVRVLRLFASSWPEIELL